MYVKIFVATMTAMGAGFLLSRPAPGHQAAGEITVSVPGIPGPYCMYGIEKRLSGLPEVADVQLDWAEEEIRIVLKPGASTTEARIEEAIEEAEYPYDYRIEL